MQLAQNLILPGTSGTVTIQGPSELETRFPDFSLASIITRLLPFVFALAGLILFIMFIWGGFDLLTSGGDSNKVQSARGKITGAIVGFVIIFVAYWLTRLVAFIFGLEGF